MRGQFTVLRIFLPIIRITASRLPTGLFFFLTDRRTGSIRALRLLQAASLACASHPSSPEYSSSPAEALLLRPTRFEILSRLMCLISVSAYGAVFLRSAPKRTFLFCPGKNNYQPASAEPFRSPRKSSPDGFPL